MSTKKKTVSRFGQYRHLAGNADDGPANMTADASTPVGVVGGLAAAQATAGHRVRQVDPRDLIPHPFNDPKRSEANAGEKWDVLLRSVQAQGVRLPALVVTRHAFLAARPALADALGEGTYVLVYGHRRAAAARAAGVDTMPAAVDDEVLVDDGDLDLMSLENIGREDLDPMAEARMFARYAEDVGLTQSAIAERLGVDQTTVSRRLALLLLSEEAVAAVESGRLSATAGAALAGTLPYGPHRKWQRGRQSDQDSSARLQDQTIALDRILNGDESPSRAAELVLEESKSRRRAAELGIRLVTDPTAELGGPAIEVAPDSAEAQNLVGTIDSVTGALLVWASKVPVAPAREDAAPVPDLVDDELSEPLAAEAAVAKAKPKKGREKAKPTPLADAAETTAAEKNATERAAAADARLTACAAAAQHVPGKNDLAEILAEAIAHGIDTASERVRAQADTWPTGSGKTGTGSYGAHAAVAWRRVLAGYETATAAAGESWGPAQTTYVELLAARVRTFKPTPWERRVMHGA